MFCIVQRLREHYIFDRRNQRFRVGGLVVRVIMPNMISEVAEFDRNDRESVHALYMLDATHFESDVQLRKCVLIVRSV